MKKIILLLLLTQIINLVDAKPVGLPNCGNSCYLNAATQALYNVYPLTKLLSSVEIISPDQIFPYAYQQLIQKINVIKEEVIKKHVKNELPEDKMLKKYQDASFDIITQRTGQGPNEQEDASEFLYAAFDEFKNSTIDVNNLISNLFGFFIAVKTECPNPLNENEKLTYYIQSKKEEPEANYYLTVPIAIQADPKKNIRRKLLTTVDESLDEYFSEQLFDNQEDWITFEGEFEGLEYLKGQKIANCTQAAQLVNAPEVLIISLKRTDWDKKTKQPVRLSHKVEIPFNINIKKFMREPLPNIYDYTLINVITQRGTRAEGGHYVAYVNDNNQWYLCNDSSIQAKQPEDIQDEINKNGYVLFYQKEEPSSQVPSIPSVPPTTPRVSDGKKLKQELTALANRLQEIEQQLQPQP